MSKILIVTAPDDIHATLTQIGLEHKGHQAILWHTADFPAQQFHAFSFAGNDLFWNASGPNFKIENDEFDVVWYRRPLKPVLANFVHPEDKKNAEKEAFMLYQTFWEVIASDAFWINPPVAARRANSKLLQLKLATDIGLNIPRTLFSNDPEEIKKFLKGCEINGKSTIYKTLYPLSWERVDDFRLTYSTKINSSILPSDNALKIAPGIFQENIQKAYELRVTYFGKYPVAVKLLSQQHPKGISDWRYVPTPELKIEEYHLPEIINQKCQLLMKKLGLVFGCFDLIVTPDQEYYFLEVNQAGQFLWIEKLNPDIKMLDIFTEFLVQKKEDFEWKIGSQTISANYFSDEAIELLQKNVESHLNVEI